MGEVFVNRLGVKPRGTRPAQPVDCERPSEYFVPENGDRFTFESWMSRDDIASEEKVGEFVDRAEHIPV